MILVVEMSVSRMDSGDRKERSKMPKRTQLSGGMSLEISCSVLGDFDSK